MGAPSILIAAGGTAGHVMPALAVAEELSARGATVVFAGAPDRVEATLTTAAGYDFEPFRVAPLERRVSLALARAAAIDAAAPAVCLGILRRVRPAAVLGGGGFVSGPMVMAARALRIPAVLTESDSHIGLANRLAVPLVRRVFLAWPIDGRTGPRYEVVGRAVRRAFFETDRASARAKLGIDQDAFVLGAFGARAGARRINEAVVDAYGDGSFDGIVLHQSGDRDLERVRAAVTAAADRYRLIGSTDRFWELLAAVDLCISRSGGQLFELAAVGVAAILVPYPYATADHQRLNAEHARQVGGATIIDDGDLDGARLRAEVERLRGEPGRLDAMRQGMRTLARPEAARRIADELLRIAGQA